MTNQMILINQIILNHLYFESKHNKRNIIFTKTNFITTKYQNANKKPTENSKLSIKSNEKPSFITSLLTKFQFTNFTQIQKTAESHQMTTNSYIMDDIANIVLNIRLEPINTTLHKNWTYRLTEFKQQLEQIYTENFQDVPLGKKQTISKSFMQGNPQNSKEFQRKQ